MTESLVAGSFKYTEVAQAAIVTDLSPTPVPTGRPTQLTTIMRVLQPITGVTSDQASSATFTNTVLKTVQQLPSLYSFFYALIPLTPTSLHLAHLTHPRLLLTSYKCNINPLIIFQ